MIRGRGKVDIGDVRPLRREDLAALAEPRAPARTKTFRDTHHNVARMVAAGMRPGDIVEQSGYSHGRINALMIDPAFQDLVSYYRSMVDESFKEQLDATHRQMILARGKAIRMLNDKLEVAEENDELPPVRELLGILELTADRTGYGKRETKVNVNLDFAGNLEKALSRMKSVRSLDSTPVIEPPRMIEVPPAPSGARIVGEVKRRI